MSKKRCSCCGRNRAKKHYATNKKNRDRLQSRCRDCNREYDAARVLKPEGRAKKLHAEARGRARKKQIEFTLTHDWVTKRVKKGICEATGLDFDFAPSAGSRVNPYAPSIDKKNKLLGYTPDNSQVTIAAYNLMKNEYDEDLIIEVAEAIKRERARRKDQGRLPCVPHTDVEVSQPSAAH